MSTNTEDSSSQDSTMTVYALSPRIFLRLREKQELTPDITARTALRQITAQMMSLPAPDGEHIYSFRRVFQPSEEVTQITEAVGRSVIKQLVYGQSPLLLMQGDMALDKEQSTLLFECLEELFKSLPSQLAPRSLFQWNGCNQFEFSKNNKLKNTSDIERKDSQGCSIFVSFLEVYTNRIYDLLATEQVEPKALVIKEFSQDLEKLFYPSNCEHFEIRNAEEGLKLLVRGEQSRRHINATLNAQEQGCHTIFTVSLVQQGRGAVNELNHQRSIQWSQLSFVDLGKVKLKRVPQDDSFLILKECLNQLRRGAKCSSQRKSRLTQLLARHLEQPSAVNFLIFLSPMDHFYEEKRQLLEVAELTDKKINFPQAKGNPENFNSSKLRLLINDRCQQLSLVKQAAQRLRLGLTSMESAMCQLRTDNSALLAANHLQQKQLRNAETKLKSHINFTNQLFNQLSQARKDTSDLRGLLCDREKLCSVQEQTITIAKDRMKRLRRSYENREQHLVSMQSSKVTQLRVQLQLKEEELKRLRRQGILIDRLDQEEICRKEPNATKTSDSNASRSKALVAKTIAGSCRKAAANKGLKE